MKMMLMSFAAVIALAACPQNPVKENAGGDPSLPNAPAGGAATTPPAPPATPPAATDGGAATATGTAAAADPKAEAEQIFTQRCSTCHGMDGTGNGPAAAALPVKPRNYTDAAWQKSVDDATLAKVIVEGGQAIGKSPLMTANPDLKDKPEVVAALVAKIRSFGPK